MRISSPSISGAKYFLLLSAAALVGMQTKEFFSRYTQPPTKLLVLLFCMGRLSQHFTVNLSKRKNLGLLLLFFSGIYVRDCLSHLPSQTAQLTQKEFIKLALTTIIHFVRGMPYLGPLSKKITTSAIQQKTAPLLSDMREDFITRRDEKDLTVMPKEGMEKNTIIEYLDLNKKVYQFHLKIINERENPRSIKDMQFLSGTRYLGNSKLEALMMAASTRYAYSNIMHEHEFTRLKHLESCNISMITKLYKGNHSVKGYTTSGGTMSIWLSMLAYLRHAWTTRGYHRKYNIVIPETAHPAFYKIKETNYNDIDLKVIPVSPETGKVDLELLVQAIDRNTIAVVGSAPNYPYGTADDMTAISNIVMEKMTAYNTEIGLHMDACLGLFLLPSLKETQIYNFKNLPALTSISGDPHKYGQTLKGNSCIIIKENYFSAQIFEKLDSLIGIYATKSLPGSTPGEPIAHSHLSFIYFGQSGFKKMANWISRETTMVVDFINRQDGLSVVGKPFLGSFAVQSDDNPNDIYKIAEILKRQEPIISFNALNANTSHLPAIHFTITPLHASQLEWRTGSLAKLIAQQLSIAYTHIKQHAHEQYSNDVKVYGHLGKLFDEIPNPIKQEACRELAEKFLIMENSTREDLIQSQLTHESKTDSQPLSLKSL